MIEDVRKTKCNVCRHLRNCINGRFCAARGYYVEYAIITECSLYEERKQQQENGRNRT